MEEFLDALWFKIEILIHHLKEIVDFILSPLNSLGPTIAIATTALITVLATKYFTKKFKTKRYKELKKDFVHWYNVRLEATRCEDYKKGRLLAKSIDSAKLNKVYYDLFLEGLLNNVLTMYLPILLLLAYVNESYKTSNLVKLCGREYIFRLRSFNGDTLEVGAAFWFVLSILLVYLCWFIVEKLYVKFVAEERKKPEPYAREGNHFYEQYHDAG
jgi:hypothetical protein